jgi:3-keto-5-aminohexanoate cleavage enzyme
MRPIIIAVAITGSVPRKKDNPAVPVTPSEQNRPRNSRHGHWGCSHLKINTGAPYAASSRKVMVQARSAIRPGGLDEVETHRRGRNLGVFRHRFPSLI